MTERVERLIGPSLSATRYFTPFGLLRHDDGGGNVAQYETWGAEIDD